MALRKFDGSAIDDSITCMTVSKHHSLIATGSWSGNLTIWDFETGKIDQMHVAAESKIIFLQFLDPYPILVAGGVQGYVTVWATRGAPIDIRY